MELRGFTHGESRKVVCENLGCRSENVVITELVFRDILIGKDATRVKFDMHFECRDCGFRWVGFEDVLVR